MKYLNLGCGKRFHPNWTNIDFRSTSPNVIQHNLIHGIPFPDNSFPIIYHSHVLEHLTKSQATLFLKECYRVLCHQGIIRVAVPDLESIARSYIFALEQSLLGSKEASENYNWLMLELIDQIARNRSGGEMASYLFQENIPNQDFILKRIGVEAQVLIDAGRHKRKSLSLKSKNTYTQNFSFKFFNHLDSLRDRILKTILSSDEYQSLKIGKFRLSGENHQWMYDRYSLANELKKCNFQCITQRTASESYIPHWKSFNLDTEADGAIYKPDSLFMEAIKPSA